MVGAPKKRARRSADQVQPSLELQAKSSIFSFDYVRVLFKFHIFSHVHDKRIRLRLNIDSDLLGLLLSLFVIIF